jgi:hypothetical protein
MTTSIHEHIQAVSGSLGFAELAAIADHSERVRHLVAHVPPAVWDKVSGAVATRYRPLEERYGRPTAIAIISAGIVGTAVPLPGTTLLAVAPVIAAAELHHRLVAHGLDLASLVHRIPLAESEILHLGRQWMQDLTGVLQEE